jgi:glycosyltransferase involved in cell wall biosynthesis
MKQNIRVGIVSAFNPHIDKKAHSGILYRINQAIEDAGCTTIWIRNKESKLYKLFARICGILNMIFSKKIYFDRTILGSYLLYYTLDKKSISTVDYIVVIHYFHVVYWLKTKKPIIYHSDVTFELANNYYLRNMWTWNQYQAEKIEIGTLRKASFHLSSSKWRNQSVMKHYNISSDKCKILEYGPCIDSENIQHEKLNDGILHLLFFGVVWERKGGNIAVDTCEKLNSMGICTELVIVGLKKIPDVCKGKDFIRFVGYLDKNDIKQYEYLKTILSQTDILILPTKAECSAVVFSEAAAYGIPVITYDTGGIGNYVINGLNGYRLQLSDDSESYANKIKFMVEHNELTTLSKGGKKLYQEKLNWNNWTVFFKRYFDVDITGQI